MLEDKRLRVRKDQNEGMKKARDKDGIPDAVWIRGLIDKNLPRRLNR